MVLLCYKILNKAGRCRSSDVRRHFYGKEDFSPRVAPLRGKSCFQSSPVRRRGCLKAGHHKEQFMEIRKVPISLLNGELAYLKNSHRHIFFITAEFPVRNANREIEIISQQNAAYRYHHRAVSSESLSGAVGYSLFLFLHKKCRPPLTASCSVRSVFRLPV